MEQKTTTDLLQDIRSGVSTLKLKWKIQFLTRWDMNKVCEELHSSAIQSIHLYTSFWQGLLENEQRQFLLAVGSMQKLRSVQIVSSAESFSSRLIDLPVSDSKSKHFECRSIGFNLQITSSNLGRLIQIHQAWSKHSAGQKTSFDFNRHYFRPTDCHPLLYTSIAPQLSTCTELRFLIFEPENMWPSFDPVLDKVQALSQLPRLTSLHLDTVHWREVWLALEQQQECTIQTLALQKPLMSVDDGRSLGKLLSYNTSLQTLMVSIRADVVEAVVEELAKVVQQKNTTLQALYLSCSGTPWAVRSLRREPLVLDGFVNALKTNHSLQIYFDYGGNPPPDTAAHDDIKIQSMLNAAGRSGLYFGSGKVASSRRWVKSLARLNEIHKNTGAAQDQQVNDVMGTSSRKWVPQQCSDEIHLTCLYSLLRSNPSLCSLKR